MRTTLAIAEKELKTYFASPIAYVVTAAFLVMTGYLFALILLNTREASLRFLMGNISVILLLIAPLLTMRLVAEEQRSGTMELLLTCPVRDTEVVLGKFLAALVFLLAMLALTIYYPLLLFMWGHPDGGPILTGYLGIVLLGAAFLAVGLLASSLTQNQIVAAVLAFGALLILWLSGSLSNFTGPPFSRLFAFLSVTNHFDDFTRGVIETSNVAYYLSVVAACLFLAVRSLETRRWR